VLHLKRLLQQLLLLRKLQGRASRPGREAPTLLLLLHAHTLLHDQRHLLHLHRSGLVTQSTRLIPAMLCEMRTSSWLLHHMMAG
jgi:hypothetical protein